MSMLTPIRLVKVSQIRVTPVWIVRRHQNGYCWGVSSGADAAFAANLRALRSQTKTTQADLAAKMSARGFKWHPATVYKVENGERQIQLAEALEIARIFDQPVENMARDDRADQLIEVREQHRMLRWNRSALIDDVRRLHTEAHIAGCTLAADRDARRLLPPDELREIVEDIRTTEALARALLHEIGESPSQFFATFSSTRLGEVSTDFDAAMRVLTKDVEGDTEA